MTEAQREQFSESGYTVVRDILSDRELDGMREEMGSLIASAPAEAGSEVDREGRQVLLPSDFAFSELKGGQQVLYRISRQLGRSKLMRIVYANPKLLGLVETLYGREFVPFAESIIVKQPQDGAGIPFHQDGKTHPEVRRRGLNVGIYLQPATEDNGCLRVVPGSHLTGVVNVKAMREQSGPVLPGSVPLEVDANCIAVHDRTLIHGSLPNTSPDLRITVYFGYHSLASIEPIHDADHITRRAQLVTLCVEERRASGWFPDETPYDYALSERAPQLSTEKERTEILRTPALAL